MQAQKDARAFEPFSLVGVTIFQIGTGARTPQGARFGRPTVFPFWGHLTCLCVGA